MYVCRRALPLSRAHANTGTTKPLLGTTDKRLPRGASPRRPTAPPFVSPFPLPPNPPYPHVLARRVGPGRRPFVLATRPGALSPAGTFGGDVWVGPRGGTPNERKKKALEITRKNTAPHPSFALDDRQTRRYEHRALFTPARASLFHAQRKRRRASLAGGEERAQKETGCRRLRLPPLRRLHRLTPSARRLGGRGAPQAWSRVPSSAPP